MSKLCPHSKKRMFRSAGAARRSARQRYGYDLRTYRCPSCGRWHITSQGVPREDRDVDPQLEQLVDVALGKAS